MKPSHLHTPRAMSECKFVTGYGLHKPRRDWCAIGHRAVAWISTGAIAAFVILVYLGAV